ncbi:MAG: hypothetical protein M1823_004849 [Watsoniomyces obsoletus]|nr:MAG: hypothetical protein M1823_004849 [Watsoniomyces obsoletus]
MHQRTHQDSGLLASAGISCVDGGRVLSSEENLAIHMAKHHSPAETNGPRPAERQWIHEYEQPQELNGLDVILWYHDGRSGDPLVQVIVSWI